MTAENAAQAVFEVLEAHSLAPKGGHVAPKLYSNLEYLTVDAFLITLKLYAEPLPTTGCMLQKIVKMTPTAVQEGITWSEIWQQYQKPRRGSSLRLLIAIDEMGRYNTAVRALCALSGDAVKAAVEEKAGFKLPSVTFYLAAAGTGIGASEGSTNGIFPSEPGSKPPKYSFYRAYDGDTHDSAKATNGNVAIFCSFLSQVSVKFFNQNARRLHPLFVVAVRENARMAALLGSRLYSAFSLSENDRSTAHQHLLLSLDLSMFLGNALFAFKSLNSLSSVPFCTLWSKLLQAVRMHFFPLALTKDSKDFEVSTGLVTFRGGPSPARDCPAAGFSPFGLPTFSVALLSMLTGNAVITKSLSSGAALEEYVLGTFFVLACAACSSDLFLTALDFNGGQMAPLWNVDFAPTTNEGDSPQASDDQSRAKKILHLPRPTGDTLVCVVHDIARDVSVPTAPASRARAHSGTYRHLLETVRRRLDAFRPTAYTPGLERVAFFRSPDRAVFADVFGLLDQRLFLFRSKEMETVERVDEERWKMGALDAAATAARPKPPCVTGQKRERNGVVEKATPRECLVGIVKAWYDATGVQIRSVHHCFVTPQSGPQTRHCRPKEEKDTFEVTHEGCSWTVSIARTVRFVSVEHITFMRFEAHRMRHPPHTAQGSHTSDFAGSAESTLVQAVDVECDSPRQQRNACGPART